MYLEHLQEELYKQIKEEKGIVTIFLKSGVRNSRRSCCNRQIYCFNVS